jgi:hypothetical protein
MYPILALLGLMLLTWSITIWASLMEDDQPVSSYLPQETIRKPAA